MKFTFPFFKNKHYILRSLFLGEFIRIFFSRFYSSSIHSHYPYPQVFPPVDKGILSISCTLHYFVPCRHISPFKLDRPKLGTGKSLVAWNGWWEEAMGGIFKWGGETPRTPWLNSEAAAHKSSLKIPTLKKVAKFTRKHLWWRRFYYWKCKSLFANLF